MLVILCFFFFNYTATTEIYTYLPPLSLHDALPIYSLRHQPSTPRDQTLARRMRLKKTPARGRRSSGLHGAEISPPCPTGQAPPCRCRGHGRTRCPARRRSSSPGPATTASAPPTASRGRRRSSAATGSAPGGSSRP